MNEHRACRRASELISQSLDRPLDRAERRSLFWHLLLCRSCRAFRKHVEGIRGFLRNGQAPPLRTSYLSTTLSPEARERLRETVTRGASPP
ncbi:MAG: zf-HC2 domain-containing protein [Planctomycetota bacterium]|jgi:hypothetical protein